MLFFTFLVFLAVLAGIFFVVRYDYLTWESEFEGKHVDSDYVYLMGEDADSLNSSINTKINEFSSNAESIDFIELTDREAVYLIGKQYSLSTPENFTVDRLYLDAEINDWKVYIQGSYQGIELPWLILRIEKDDIETAQLYVSEMAIGKYDLDEWGLLVVREDVNTGFQDALILVNENDFTGRKFENIELTQDSMVIKGRK